MNRLLIVAVVAFGLTTEGHGQDAPKPRVLSWKALDLARELFIDPFAKLSPEQLQDLSYVRRVRWLVGESKLSAESNDALKAERGRFDFILTTVNVSLNWPLYMRALRAEGKLITVGMVQEPMGIPAAMLIGGQRVVSGSDTGPPDMVADMLEFCVRHDIKPMIEKFPMSDCNAAIDRLKSGKARYRIVLEN